MDYDLGEQAEGLRQRLRELVQEHVPEGFLGAFTDDPEDLATTQRFCKLLAAEGLPAISAGDVIWCQGFSEPDAGSDLAALKTRAEPDPAGGWRITGQKVWTSYALMAQWCILAARTSVKPVKHAGITMFLVPMDTKGITVRPIPNLLGPHHLNELFLDDVRVGPEDVLGEVGEGWSVIREALKFERIGIARYARCDRLLTLLREALGERWAGLPAALRARWTRARVHTRAAMVLAYRVVDAQAKGVVDDADASVAQVADDGHTRHPVLHGAVEDHWRYTQAATVASGTIEIQRMLVARAALAAR